MSTINRIQKELFKMQDQKYRVFQGTLIPNISMDSIIGVQIPILRKMAKMLYKSTEATLFLQQVPHMYYEENNLHVFILCEIKNYRDLIEKLNNFLPYVDNWATCDSIRPKIFKKHIKELLYEIKYWVNSNHNYTQRFGIEMLMCHFLDDEFSADYLELVASIKSEEYYVNMMISWYFATALVKQWESAIPYIKERKLNKWIHNKVIQKSIESNRISMEQKKYLRTLK